MKIGVRLIIGYSALILGVFAVYFVGSHNIATLHHEFEIVVDNKFPNTVLAIELTNAVNDEARATRNMAISNTPEERNKTRGRITKNNGIINDAMSKLENSIASDNGKHIIDQIKDTRSKYIEERDLYFRLYDDGQMDTAIATLMNGKLRKYQNEYFELVDNLIDQLTKEIKASGLAGEAISDKASTMLIMMSILVALIGIINGFFLIRSIIRPLKKAVDAAENISRGNMDIDLETKNKDETGILLHAMKKMADNINQLIDESKKISVATLEGKLDFRGNEEKFDGAFKEIVQGMNVTLDSVIGPLNIAAEYIDRISKGDIPPKITESYRGDFNEIKNNLNLCIDNISMILSGIDKVSKDISNGKLDERGNAALFTGDWANLVLGINSIVDNIVRPMNLMAEYVDRISKGDIPQQIIDVYHGDFNEIKNNLNMCIHTISGLISDIHSLSNVVREGKLYVRADATKHTGDFRRIVEEVNGTIDAVVSLLDNMPAPAMIINNQFEVIYMNNAGAGVNNTTGLNLFKNEVHCYDHFRTSDCRTDRCACARSISSGANATSETDAHPGIYNLDISYSSVPIKNRDNKVVAVLEVVTDLTEIKKNSAKIAKMARYQDNETEKLKNCLASFSKGEIDFNYSTEFADEDTREIKDKFDVISSALNDCQNAVNALIKDTVMLSNSAVEGRLDIRANAMDHNGENSVR